jgi:4-aminobutyrate aminotransferase
LEELILTTTPGRVACFLAEPIQGVGGFITPPPEYFGIAAEIVRKHGGLFIADEVQTGFGRTGGKMFGIEHWGVEPDIMTCAKGFANGLPIGGTITTAEIAECMTGLTISTFGGSPVTCTAALATIDVLEKDDLVRNVSEVGSYFFDRLYGLQEKYPIMGDVRGKGLMIGIEMVKEDRAPNPEAVLKVFELSRKKRLLLGKGGLYGNVLRVTPPLNINKGDVDEAVRILDEVMTEI